MIKSIDLNGSNTLKLAFILCVTPIYSYMGRKNLWRTLTPHLVKISKKQNSTSDLEFYSLFIQNIFNFWFRLPVFENSHISGFEVPTGSGKVPHAIARVELYMPPKFHANRSTRLGAVAASHIKQNASQFPQATLWFCYSMTQFEILVILVYDKWTEIITLL